MKSGKPRVRVARITLSNLLERLAGGMGDNELPSDPPTLTRESVHAVLAFAATRERRWNQRPTA